jgi:BMFP domain-containing protein YqiC
MHGIVEVAGSIAAGPTNLKGLAGNGQALFTLWRLDMQSENRFFDDLAKVASGALGSLAGFGSEVETRLRDQAEKVLARMDVVRREEFDAVKAMAAKARETQEALEARVAALEAEIAALRLERDTR